MSIESILLLGPDSLGEVVEAVEKFLAVKSDPGGDGRQIYLPESETLVGVYRAEYVDEPGLPLSRYRFVVDTAGPDGVNLAERLYTDLARCWEAMWMSNSVVRRSTVETKSA